MGARIFRKIHKKFTKSARREAPRTECCGVSCRAVVGRLLLSQRQSAELSRREAAKVGDWWRRSNAFDDEFAVSGSYIYCAKLYLTRGDDKICDLILDLFSDYAADITGSVFCIKCD